MQIASYLLQKHCSTFVQNGETQRGNQINPSLDGRAVSLRNGTSRCEARN